MVRRVMVRVTGVAGDEVRLEVLHSGQVRLTGQDVSGTWAAETDTIEAALLEAAATPYLSPELYDAFFWEVDLLGLRGDV